MIELVPDMSRFVGKMLGDQYEILEPIGKGAMGVVFRARQVAVGREVAIKILHRHLLGHEPSVLRFENEARSISLLRHPNTLRMYDCRRTDEGDLFIVTELLSGRPLSDLLADRGRLELERVVPIVDQI